jgi:hypothetical protein
MSPSVDTRTWGPPSRAGLSEHRPFVVLIVIGLLAVALLAPRLGLPAKVPPLTIDNPTSYPVFVEASGPAAREWTPVAVVQPHHSEVETEVVDEGAVWNLRFTSQGVVLAGYQVSRGQLAADHWTYTVPADVSVRLQASGAPPGA